MTDESLTGTSTTAARCQPATISDQPRTVNEALAILMNTDPEDIRKAARSMGIGMQEAADNLAAAFREVHWWKATTEEFSVVDEED